MSAERYTYAIVGGGLAGASAVEGIRDLDKEGPILLVGEEESLPYDRPPLTKKLWLGKKKVEEIILHNREFYEQNGVNLKTGVRIASLDTNLRTVTDVHGKSYEYKKLLLATGGVPRSLTVPGGNLPGICYYRYLRDYLRIRGEAAEGRTATVIGGGFIGSEIAAALNVNKVYVTMVFPSPYLCSRVFPDYLGHALVRYYEQRGIKVMTGQTPASVVRTGSRFSVRTSGGTEIASDIVIAGVGISPAIALAEGAGLNTGDGVRVNEYLQTSHPDIYAAGDNALFPYQALAQQMRVEHWDNALSQGRLAGRNMAGAREPFTSMPYFFSDLFDFGYEAVGEVDSALETFADWQKENSVGVIYYLKDRKVRGAMMCNVWDKVDAARELIRRAQPADPETLRGRIR